MYVCIQAQYNRIKWGIVLFEQIMSLEEDLSLAREKAKLPSIGNFYKAEAYYPIPHSSHGFGSHQDISEGNHNNNQLIFLRKRLKQFDASVGTASTNIHGESNSKKSLKSGGGNSTDVLVKNVNVNAHGSKKNDILARAQSLRQARQDRLNKNKPKLRNNNSSSPNLSSPGGSGAPPAEVWEVVVVTKRPAAVKVYMVCEYARRCVLRLFYSSDQRYSVHELSNDLGTRPAPLNPLIS